AARPHPEDLVEQIGIAKREARRTDSVGEPLQIDAPFFKRYRQPQTGFLVLQEQALAVASRQCAAQCGGFRDGKDRRMRVSAVRDAKGIEAGKQLIRRQMRLVLRRVRHAATMRLPMRRRKRLQTPTPDMIWIARTRA